MLTISMQTCIQACLKCYQVCTRMTATHCLETGGDHVEPDHIRLMLACSEICRTNAHLMLIDYADHKKLCALCATICEACARSCEKLNGMEECVDACMRCAAACKEMANH